MNGVAEQWCPAATRASPGSFCSTHSWRRRWRQHGPQSAAAAAKAAGIEFKRRPSLSSNHQLQVFDGSSRRARFQKFDDHNCCGQSVNLGRAFVCGSHRRSTKSSSKEEAVYTESCRNCHQRPSSIVSAPMASASIPFFPPCTSPPTSEFGGDLPQSLTLGAGRMSKPGENSYRVDNVRSQEALEDSIWKRENSESVLLLRELQVRITRNSQSHGGAGCNVHKSFGDEERKPGDDAFSHALGRGAAGGNSELGLHFVVAKSWVGCPSSCVPVTTMMISPAGTLGRKNPLGFSHFLMSRKGSDVAGSRSHRRALCVSATAESASEISLESEESQDSPPSDALDSGSVPKIRKPKSMRNIQAADDIQVLNGRRSGTDPWFSKSHEHTGSSKKFRESIMQKSIQRLKSEVDKSNKDLEQSSTRPSFSDKNVRAPVWAVGGKSRTVVPRRQARDTQSSHPQTATVYSILQALDKISNSKGIASLMEQYTGELSTQDLKQVLTELGTSPERNWAKALQVFDWAHASSVYSVDPSMYHTMLLLLGKAKKMEIAELLFDRMKQDGLTPGLYEYTALVSGHVRTGSLQRGIAVLNRMKSAGIRPSVATYNILVDGCLKVPKGFEIASSLLEQMRKDDLRPDRVTYTTMIIVYSRKGHHKEAINIFREMLEQDCHPDILTYNAVLNAHGKLGDIQGMLHVHQSMVAQQVDPDTVTFNIILSALARAGRTKDVVRFYRLMRKIRVTPDVTTCSILVNAYGKVREWKELDSLLAEMESLGLQPDLAVYNSLISIYGKAGRFEQVDLLTKSLHSSNNIKFDLITYNTLIDVFGKAGRLSDVIKWFSDMRKRGVKPDVRTFNALVHAYGRASQYDGVREVLDLFLADGSKPDLVFYHTLLFMFGKGAKYDDAWRVIEDMKAEGYTLSLEIYNSLLLVFGRSDADEAMKVFKDMIASKVTPNSNTFKVLIEVHARKGKVDECLSIYKTSMEYLPEQVNESVLSSLLGACCNMRRIEKAEEILSQLEKKRFSVSLACFNWLILGYGRQGDWANAEIVLDRMRSQRVTPNSQSYTFLLEAYSLCGLFEKADSLSRRMQQEDNLNSISACNALLRLYVRSGKPQAALEVFENLLTGKIGRPNQSSYTGIISAYGEDDLVNEKIWEYLRGLEASQLESMHGIYTALLSAIPRCKSYKEGQQFVAALGRLDCPSELCCILTDTLSDGVGEEVVWVNLAARFRTIDQNGFNLETQRSFQNALIDALWWFGWELRALRVVKMSMDFGIFGRRVFSWLKSSGWTVDMRGASAGAAQILLLIWIAQMRKVVLNGGKPSTRVKILVAEEWQLIVGENKAAREALDAHLEDLGAPFPAIAGQTEVEASGTAIDVWLKQEHLDKKLFFVDSLPANQR
ncbi:protein MpPPR_38 [Marchantia polymorpha subsp. ruderalis]|uniref:PROP1-like PPR domain-containing protein n=2 Tax=Marchantia polymorpha TaxID=3197 RepID=A0AAF6BRD1_MARPO|nr:hypothetical protein MARPO_0059s0080 [Marchantia polymorpha]BBN14565.1 hypothetical protein Mp_6g12660 [Marchantia polymorpha subsp. ruderalis]|eukprot:PTQ37154.1 hypothetical protein MARPO_0059s0080 [Marchantia polymorpha]